MDWRSDNDVNSGQVCVEGKDGRHGIGLLRLGSFHIEQLSCVSSGDTLF